MMMKTFIVPLLLVLNIGYTAFSKSHETIYLWPDQVPGETELKAPPLVSGNHKGNVTRLSKVTNPALIVFEAKPKHRNGAAVIICPGGGYRILAIDKEGYEVAQWLSNLGYTAFVLQYRVPNKKLGALQDVQRAIGHVRGHHKKWNIHTDKIGILGFSAGGSLCALASTQYRQKKYEPIDTLDEVSGRPDFSILIYPAYLDQGKNHSLTPEIKVNKETPPMFLYAAYDDKKHVNSSLVMSAALREKNVPFELHILARGGHGYGLRPGSRITKMWPKQCEAWMKETIFK